MAKSVQVKGTVQRTIETVSERWVDDPQYRNAKLKQFERVAGVSPKIAVGAVVRGAAEKCRVKDCELTARVEDQVKVRGGFGIPPNEIEESKDRDIKVELTCPRSCSRQACQSVISRATETVEGLLDEAAGGVVGSAKRTHMKPAEQKAEEIRAAAEAEAEEVLAAARSGVETAGDQALVDFRSRYNLAPPQAG